MINNLISLSANNESFSISISSGEIKVSKLDKNGNVISSTSMNGENIILQSVNMTNENYLGGVKIKGNALVSVETPQKEIWPDDAEYEKSRKKWGEINKRDSDRERDERENHKKDVGEMIEKERMKELTEGMDLESMRGHAENFANDYSKIFANDLSTINYSNDWLDREEMELRDKLDKEVGKALKERKDRKTINDLRVNFYRDLKKLREKGKEIKRNKEGLGKILDKKLTKKHKQELNAMLEKEMLDGLERDIGPAKKKSANEKLADLKGNEEDEIEKNIKKECEGTGNSDFIVRKKAKNSKGKTLIEENITKKLLDYDEKMDETFSLREAIVKKFGEKYAPFVDISAKIPPIDEGEKVEEKDINKIYTALKPSNDIIYPSKKILKAKAFLEENITKQLLTNDNEEEGNFSVHEALIGKLGKKYAEIKQKENHINSVPPFLGAIPPVDDNEKK